MLGPPVFVNAHDPQKSDHTASSSSNGSAKKRTGLGARRPPRIKRRRPACPDLELTWTKLGDAILEEATEADVAKVALVPAAAHKASAANIEEEAKHGLDHLQVVETDDPHVAVAHWHVKAVGNRPRDYLGRELLYGSLLRDHRPRWFHNYSKHPAEWMLPLVKLPDERTQAIAVQHLSLDYLHRRHLLRRMTEQQELGDFADDRECSLLADLWYCTPYGVLAQWNGPGRRKLAHCNHTWFCPWCFARRVVDLYERLQRGPLKQPAGKHLVLGRATVIGNLYGHVDADLNPTEARAVRKYLGGFLQQAVARLGVSGGLVSYQLGPTVRDIDPNNSIDRVLGFQHELAVLGEVSFRNAQEERRFQHHLGAVNLGNHPGGQDILIHWLTMPAEQVNALRLLLVGSGPGFDLDRVEWQALNGDSQQSYITKKGLSGAFAVQPLFMLDQRQWHFYRLAVHHLHLFDVFGSWRSALSRISAMLRPRSSTWSSAFLIEPTTGISVPCDIWLRFASC